MSPASEPAASSDINIDRLLLIVVGAHLRAEVTDRPLAYRLRETILRWSDDHTDPAPDSGLYPIDSPLDPLVCTDLWYLNDDDLAHRPTISIGEPGVNAVSAFLGTRLPMAFVIEQTLQVQLDVELNTLRACMWGQEAASTVSAVDAFVERYLDRFLLRAHGEPLGSGPENPTLSP